jgi:thiol-disulfide isomerase/thioredoxin
MRSQLIYGGIAAALLTVSACSGVVQATGGETAPTNGRSIATLSQIMVDTRAGARITLGSRITPGKPTLISIWASWCPPCIAEAPYLSKIRRQLGRKYNFVYVNRRDGEPDKTQPPASIATFLTRSGMADIDYVIADVHAYQQIIGKDMADIPDGKVGIPRVYLFDKAGRQIHTARGFDESDGVDLEARVTRAIAQ